MGIMAAVSGQTESVEVELARNSPLSILYCHGCSTRSHDLHRQLEGDFRSQQLHLLCDPCTAGEDVQVWMRRFQINGVAFHVDARSISSSSCDVELQTAKLAGCPVLCLRDDAEVPATLRSRVFVEVPPSGALAENNRRELAKAMRDRAGVHWVLRSILGGNGTPEDRSSAAAWLLVEPPQVLAEFVDEIAACHRLEKEDPTVSSLLSEVLDQTGLRAQVGPYLKRWWRAAEHPFSRDTIDEIFAGWGLESPAKETQH
jgi:hypothetical protein